MPQENPARVWFVTGCSSGMGRALAEAIAATSDKVIVTARRVEDISELQTRAPDRILALPLDITDSGSVMHAISEAIAQFGHIDILVNNAGIGLVGALEECSEDEMMAMFRTNVFGTIRVIREVLPHMRSRRSGLILAVTSVSGFQPVPMIGIYGGTKCALEGMLEAMAGEVAALGINVTILEPGLYKTDLRKSRMYSKKIITDYTSIRETMRAGLEGYPPSAGDPAKAAAAILTMVNSGKTPPRRLALGADAVSVIKNKLLVIAKEIAEWESLSIVSGGTEGALSIHSSVVPKG